MLICSFLPSLTDMEIVLASRNKKKIAELDTLLAELCQGKLKALSLDSVGYTEEIEENGRTFFENALIKASAPASLGYMGVADDSGLCVFSLNGAPGVYSARYAGEDATDEKNNEKLLSELENKDDRIGAFVCAVACVIPDELGISLPAELSDPVADEIATRHSGRPVKAFVVMDECLGEILREYRGEGGFGYDPLFYVPEKKKTFSELSAEEKNEISHRGRAMRAFAAEINKII